MKLVGPIGIHIRGSIPSLKSGMESISLQFSPLSPFPLSPSVKIPRPNHKSRGINSSSSNSFESSNYGHLTVDENMIVLRKRIHEMKMVERNYEPPSDWMEWEKEFYTSYDELVCQFVGFVQTQLMKSRPSLALGMLVAVGLSVPVSAAMVGLKLAELAGGVFPAIHG